MSFSALKAVRVAAAGAVALTLSGCFLPDKYDATISLKSDGTYAADFKGEATMVLAFVSYVQQPESGPTLDKDMKSLESQLRKEPSVKSVNHLGKARFGLDMHSEGRQPSADQQQLPLQLLALQASPGDKTLSVVPANIGQKDVEQLKQVGLASVGDICIKTDLPVVESNADSAPGIVDKCYAWKKYDLFAGKPLIFKVRMAG